MHGPWCRKVDITIHVVGVIAISIHYVHAPASIPSVDTRGVHKERVKRSNKQKKQYGEKVLHQVTNAEGGAEN